MEYARLTMGIGEVIGTVREQQKWMYEVKVLTATAAVFLFAGYTALRELRYMTFGRVTQATFVETHTSVTRDKNGRETKTPYVRYSFTDETMDAGADADDGKQGGSVAARRVESDIQDYGWTPPPAKGTIAVEYIPGSAGSSRLAGRARRWICYAFFGFTFVGTGVAIWIIRDYNAHSRRKAAWGERD